MFTDEYIPVEMTITVLLRMFATSRGQTSRDDKSEQILNNDTNQPNRIISPDSDQPIRIQPCSDQPILDSSKERTDKVFNIDMDESIEVIEIDCNQPNRTVQIDCSSDEEIICLDWLISCSKMLNILIFSMIIALKRNHVFQTDSKSSRKNIFFYVFSLLRGVLLMPKLWSLSDLLSQNYVYFLFRLFIFRWIEYGAWILDE